MPLFSLLRDSNPVLSRLGALFQSSSHGGFEVAIGHNGRVWVNSPSSFHTIVISNVILNSERNLSSPAAIDRMIKEMMERGGGGGGGGAEGESSEDAKDASSSVSLAESQVLAAAQSLSLNKMKSGRPASATRLDASRMPPTATSSSLNRSADLPTGPVDSSM